MSQYSLAHVSLWDLSVQETGVSLLPDVVLTLDQFLPTAIVVHLCLLEGSSVPPSAPRLYSWCSAQQWQLAYFCNPHPNSLCSHGHLVCSERQQVTKVDLNSLRQQGLVFASGAG